MTARYKMIDDGEWMRKICEAIEKTSTKTVLEYDLKQAFGFRRTKGHRSWRRLRKKLTDSNLITCFVGKINKTPYSCFKLTNSFDQWLQTQLNTDKPKLNITGPECNLIVENSLERQLLEKILDAGLEGITTKEICEHLGVNLKHNSKRLHKMKKRYGFEMKMDINGRIHVNRCIAPIEALEKYWKQKQSLYPKTPSIMTQSNDAMTSNDLESVMNKDGKIK